MTILSKVLILSLFLVAVGLQQFFDRQPVYTEVNARDDVLLQCHVINKRGQCVWQKDRRPVGIYEQKYEWAGNQEAGDCSLWVRKAMIEFDDGEWECQVTASDFTAQDALTSRPARLVVRAAPQMPRIEFNGSHVNSENNLTALEDTPARIKCVSRMGNPPSFIKWFLVDANGEEELTSAHPQTNTTEVDNPKTWLASSVLEFVFKKRKYGSKLKCVAYHQSNVKGFLETSVRVDVRFAPELRLEGVPEHDIEEREDNVMIRCIADANPTATIMWRRPGKSDIVSLDETLKFSPIMRRDAGTYACQAKNSIGNAGPLTVRLDVKFVATIRELRGIVFSDSGTNSSDIGPFTWRKIYKNGTGCGEERNTDAPEIVDVGTDRLSTVKLFSEAVFHCKADGNPPPNYEWLQKQPTDEGAVMVRGSKPELRIANVTYDFQGEYVCRAFNKIGDRERSVQSEPVTVQVVGAPQVLRQGGGGQQVVVVPRGESASLSLVVCSDPSPRRAAWEWGSTQLEAGSDFGRFQADDLARDSREDCYEARLKIVGAEPSDSRNYYLAVENEKGTDRHAVQLVVTEPIPMATLLSVGAGCILFILCCVALIIWTLRRRSCSRAHRGDFRPSDLERDNKNDLDDHKSEVSFSRPLENSYRGASPSGRRPHTITGSPEAMKRYNNYHHHHHHLHHSSSTSAAAAATAAANIYADLQLPTVSNRGADISTAARVAAAGGGSTYRGGSKHHHLQHHQQQEAYFRTYGPPEPHVADSGYILGHFRPRSFEKAEI